MWTVVWGWAAHFCEVDPFMCYTWCGEHFFDISELNVLNKDGNDPSSKEIQFPLSQVGELRNDKSRSWDTVHFGWAQFRCAFLGVTANLTQLTLVHNRRSYFISHNWMHMNGPPVTSWQHQIIYSSLHLVLCAATRMSNQCHDMPPHFHVPCKWPPLFTIQHSNVLQIPYCHIPKCRRSLAYIPNKAILNVPDLEL